MGPVAAQVITIPTAPKKAAVLPAAFAPQLANLSKNPGFFFCVVSFFIELHLVLMNKVV